VTAASRRILPICFTDDEPAMSCTSAAKHQNINRRTTMTLEDIEEAIETGRISDLEDAFRALVGWPHEDMIENSTPAQRKKLLSDVCKALDGHIRVMPMGMHRLIEIETDEKFEGTYGAGAVVVMRNRRRFLAVLDRN
jgi:hypothetical protein